MKIAKTRKFILKRIKITKNKKILHRPIGQDHYNVKASGKKTLAKRRLKQFSSSNLKTIQKLI